MAETGSRDTGSMLPFETPHGICMGYLTGVGSGRPPGLVVVQEYWGLVPHIKDLAQRFAAKGYVAIAPDLYHGKSTVDEAEAGHLMSGLDWGRAVDELLAAVRCLREKQGAPRVGVVGFCMGGALAILAAQDSGVDAYVSFYGFPPSPEAIKDVTAPGLIFFGEHEEHFSVPGAKAFADAQRQKGREAEVIVFPGAGHAFFNDTRPEKYDPDAAREAWHRTLAFLQRNL
jgi:carboxymethylenebutenolidase